MENKFKSLDEGEIISFKRHPLGDEIQISFNGLDWCNFTSEELATLLQRRMNLSSNLNDSLFVSGLRCNAFLYDSKGWILGKMRVKLVVEFCPDDSNEEETNTVNQEAVTHDSPLEDLRKQLNLDS